VDQHHVDADPDPTFHVDADPDPDPDPVSNPHRIWILLNFTHVRKSEKNWTFIHSSASLLNLRCFYLSVIEIDVIIFNILHSRIKFAKKVKLD
jgi:hypothetical protein